MNRPTEYIVMKRLVFARKDLDDSFDGNEANTMIRQSSLDALDRLEDADREIVERQAMLLQDNCHRMSRGCALELLAAIGDVLNGLEVK